MLEWGVRKLDQTLELKHRAGLVKLVRADLFPAYDEDGGLLACIAPHASAADLRRLTGRRPAREPGGSEPSAPRLTDALAPR